MNGYDDLSLMARAQRLAVEQSLNRCPRMVNLRPRRASFVNRLLAQAARRTGDRLVGWGRRLQCYQIRLLSQPRG